MVADEPQTKPAPAKRVKRRRRTDRFTVRDLIYLVGLLLIAFGTYLAFESNNAASRADRHAVASNKRAARADRHATSAIAQVQQGRARSITITCAVLSSISQAGKATIAGLPTPPPPAEERALEALGFPPFAVRHKAQAHAGDLYVQAISNRVNRELGQLGHKPIKGLVRKDGTIDCKVLQQAGAVPHPR